MPDKLKNLSGRQLIKILGKFNFIVVAQKGSHVKALVVSSV